MRKWLRAQCQDWDSPSQGEAEGNFTATNPLPHAAQGSSPAPQPQDKGGDRRGDFLCQKVHEAGGGPYSFTPQTFIKHVLCARQHARCLEYSGK